VFTSFIQQTLLFVYLGGHAEVIRAQHTICAGFMLSHLRSSTASTGVFAVKYFKKFLF